MFRSLQYRNFRLFFFGQFLSLTGSWIQGTALSWLLYRLTKDAFMLGLVNFVSQFPVLLLGFYAGHVVDRFNHHKIVVAMQTLAMLQASILAALTLSGRVEVWHVFALALSLGLVYAFDIPARQVMIGELVEPADRHNAIALNSTIVNGTRIIGPAVAGVLIERVGEGVCFAINAASYLSVIAGLLLMRELKQAPSQSGGSFWQEMGAGVGHALGRDPLRLSIALLIVFSVAGLPLYVLLPVFAGELGAGAKGFGALSAASGLGATVGALILAGRRSSAGLGRLIPRGLAFFGLSLGGLALSDSLRLSCFLMFLAGYAAIRVLAGVNTVLQELSSDRYRGRVMSFYSMVFIGLSPIGSFTIGALASRLGVHATVAVQAAICLSAGLYFLPKLAAAVPVEPRKVPPPPLSERPGPGVGV